MRKLVLFDIDGTLVKVEGISRNALIEALRKVYGSEGSAATYSFAGKMDGVIIYEVMRESGLLDNHIQARFEDVKQTYIDIFKQCAEQNHVQLLDGVVALLDELAAHSDVVLGLLTGNFEDSGRHKLALSGINHYFSFGAFAEDGHERIDLPEVAVDRAYHRTGKRFTGKDVVIIGDTEHDVRCAKVLNSKCIAVATGYYSIESLEAGKPDHVVENLRDTTRIKEMILSE
ncbi:Haloacid dehalogenase domain protein hydrolase [Chloroherpeton thalassium ATCC 35110]|uniref:phosphoglycolate phosphatase n=1 Tax=Chloroherpeton thalassium (strain ATCC 35110 / GB-78) TaxID=517418 RepID=B3QSQ5_CHLT3|nr:HAD family hydrolase [Chloroherpeton thalassium]ACF14102.1 Haloacid dehalogenase domain protein hydrolase [Chloroherpeton thalassium ATCC 35110]